MARKNENSCRSTMKRVAHNAYLEGYRNKWDRLPHGSRVDISLRLARAQNRFPPQFLRDLREDYPGWWRFPDDEDDVLAGDQRTRIEWSDRNKWLARDREIYPSPPPSPHTPSYSDEDDGVYPDAQVSPPSNALNASTAFNEDDFLRSLGERQKRRREERNAE